MKKVLILISYFLIASGLSGYVKADFCGGGSLGRVTCPVCAEDPFNCSNTSGWYCSQQSGSDCSGRSYSSCLGAGSTGGSPPCGSTVRCISCQWFVVQPTSAPLPTNQPTPTTPPGCSCDGWTPVTGCGGDSGAGVGCAANERYYRRNCSPDQCASEGQCFSASECQSGPVPTSAPLPTATPVLGIPTPAASCSFLGRQARVRISWSTVSNATDYVVRVNQPPYADWVNTTPGPDRDTWDTHTGNYADYSVDPNETQRYYVQARQGTNNGPHLCNIASNSPPCPTFNCPPPPVLWFQTDVGNVTAFGPINNDNMPLSEPFADGVVASTGSINLGAGEASTTYQAANSNLSSDLLRDYNYASITRKINNTVPTFNTVSAPFDNADITSGTATNGFKYYKANGNLTIGDGSNPISYGSDKIVLLVEGTATINQPIGENYVPGGNGPTGWWRMDEGVDNTCTGGVNDVCNSGTGTSIDGAKTGMLATNWAAGRVGSSLVFDGTDDYVQVADNASLEPSSGITVSTWVKTTNTTCKYLMHKIQTTAPYPGYALAINTAGPNCTSANGTLAFWSGDNTNAWASVALGAGRISDNNWHHIAATNNGTTTRLYFDGVEQTSAARTLSTVNSVNLEIGRQPFTGQITYLSGQVDEPKIYNYVRTPAQILDDYNSVAGGSGGNFILLARDDISVTNNVGDLGADPTTLTSPHLEGIFYAGRQFLSGTGGTDSIPANRRSLRVEGSVVGMGEGTNPRTGVILNRLSTTTYPGTYFVFRPDLVLNVPQSLLKDFRRFEEVAP